MVESDEAFSKRVVSQTLRREMIITLPRYARYARSSICGFQCMSCLASSKLLCDVWLNNVEAAILVCEKLEGRTQRFV